MDDEAGLAALLLDGVYFEENRRAVYHECFSSSHFVPFRIILLFAC